jgi:hypothetical protein
MSNFIAVNWKLSNQSFNDPGEMNNLAAEENYGKIMEKLYKLLTERSKAAS